MLWEEGEPRPVELTDDRHLIPWASTDNGEFAYWLAADHCPPEQWTVMVNEARGDEWEHFRMGCVDFLLGLLRREVHSEILWSRFPLDVHNFRPVATFV